MKNSVFFVGLLLATLCGLSMVNAQAIKPKSRTADLKLIKAKKKKKTTIIKSKAKPAKIKVKNKIINQKVMIKKPAKSAGNKIMVRTKQQRQVLIQPKKVKPTIKQRAKMVNSANSHGSKKSKLQIKNKKSIKTTKKSTQIKLKKRY